ncbi:MAG: patatin-like phospholipase family protein [Bacteroidota bacterium]
MKKYLVGIWRSLPLQLFLLHFRRYQVFLVFWYILFATVAGEFMFTFGANSLFLAPEYFGEVTPLSTGIVGFSIGIFIMSWNITTFILHSKNVRFLATTAQPFLKYCINNAGIPVIFLIFYLVKAVNYARYEELLHGKEVLFLVGGFTGGIIISIFIAFAYFFGADKTIYRSMGTVIKTANTRYAELIQKTQLPKDDKTELNVDWFFSARFRLRKPRDVRHYSDDFLNSVFKRHHVAAVIAIAIAFLSLILVGYTSDARLSQVPAAASITVFFAIVISVVGALSLFLRTWAIPLLVLLYIGLNILYKKEIIDPRNKAYGLNYLNKTERPIYDRETIHALANDSSIESDKKYILGLLNRWKAKQKTDKPILYIINTSGGGARSAMFTMNALQRLDSLFGGKLMDQTLLINGASGGMLGAAYFRELFYEKIKGAAINLQDKQYADDISKDLLSPLFSSFVTRDMMGPVQKFQMGGYSYSKDRGYAFEQKLNENTHGVLAKTLQDYAVPEEQALIPLMFFNSVINRDGRKMIMSTHPARFLMRSQADTNNITSVDPDAVDFNSFFQKQGSMNISILSALRMNATFPYVLPNVWLPTNPIIDVMDAGIRDNFGQETCLRFINVFKDWLQANTSKVVLLQIRDRSLGDWDKPSGGYSLIHSLTQPFTILQSNWYKLQDYYQHDQLEYLFTAYGPQFHRVCFQYVPSKDDAPASLSFHLTAAEKRDISLALDNPTNMEQFEKLKKIMR